MIAEMEAAESAGVPWTLPDALPAAEFARTMAQAIETLTVKPASAAHVAQCLARLTLAFETGTSRLSDEEVRLRAKVWREANGDLGDALWSEATLWCLRHHKFGMPRPPDFRRAVADEFNARQRKLDRCRKLLALGEARTPRAATAEEMARAERAREDAMLRTASPEKRRAVQARRLREMIESLARHGMADRVKANQARLDALERAPQAGGDIHDESKGESQ